jgi:hypothetical protein
MRALGQALAFPMISGGLQADGPTEADQAKKLAWPKGDLLRLEWLKAYANFIVR